MNLNQIYGCKTIENIFTQPNITQPNWDLNIKLGIEIFLFWKFLTCWTDMCEIREVKSREKITKGGTVKEIDRGFWVTVCDSECVTNLVLHIFIRGLGYIRGKG